MAQGTLYGAKVAKTASMDQNFSYDALGANSAIITVGDPLTLVSGSLNVVGASGFNTLGQGGTSTIIGIAVKTQTLTSTNTTVAKVTPGYIPIDNNTIFLMGTNKDLTGNATDGGTYYKLWTGGTGTICVDVAFGVTTGVDRIVEIVEVDPFFEGGSGVGSGLRKVYVRFVKTPYTNVNITA